jgi:(p)ppGpp synthase/HD superfamily hydrolase
MVLWPDEPTAPQPHTGECGVQADGAMQPVRTPMEQPSLLPRAALRFAARCHARQRRDSDGAPFIEHPREVARLLRDAGCRDVVIAAGLLHDVLEDTDATASELKARFGIEVATLVQVVSEEASAHDYRERKRRLRDQVEGAGGDALLIFAADKISKVRELSSGLTDPRARPAAATLNRLEHHVRLRLEHYEESLRMLQRSAAEHPLVARLADELDACLTGASTG